MFSYLQIAQQLAPTSIYQRGLRLYLDGRVLEWKEMILDFWREYLVEGNDKYQIKIPLLHLALSREKWELLPQAMEESVSCTCPYFEEYGVCKHIVAVCNSLDQEFSFGKVEIIKKEQSEDFLSNLFAVDEQKKQRLWLQNFEKYLINPLKDYHSERKCSKFIQEISFELNPKEHADFWQSAQKAVETALRKFEYEKITTDFALETLLLGGQTWWIFWQEFVPKFLEQNQIAFYQRLFVNRNNYPLNTFYDQIEQKLQDFSQEFKQNILESLQQNYPGQSELWIAFCLSAQYWTFLEQNLNSIEPNTLLQIGQIWPQKLELTERMVYKQLKDWVDFLPPNSNNRVYTELLQMIQAWRAVSDESPLLLDLIEHIRQTHPKKTSLLKELAGF